MYLIDVDCAFLNGELEEEIYMDIPEGYEGDNSTECLLLKKGIYGLVQSARQWWKKFVEVLRKLEFLGGEVDPCFFIRKGKHGTIMIGLYIDDCLCVGNKEELETFARELEENGLTITLDRYAKDYLGCDIVRFQAEGMIVLGQSHVISKLEKTFSSLVQDKQNYVTPGTPHVAMFRPGKEETTIDKHRHMLYRSGTGMLLYLVKHSRPDLANPVRELSKLLDCPTEAAFKELLRITKFTLDTKNRGLKIKPDISLLKNDVWSMEMYSDSDFAGDKESRLSVSGFISYFMGVPISWKSKAQRSVVLSSTEAEFVALSEAAREIKFVYQILCEMNIKVKLPIVVRVDNIGAIFLAENVTTSQRTKHVDIRYKFVRQFIFDKFLKIEFVGTLKNTSDIFTKNVSKDLYEKHIDSMLGNVE